MWLALTTHALIKERELESSITVSRVADASALMDMYPGLRN